MSEPTSGMGSGDVSGYKKWHNSMTGMKSFNWRWWWRRSGCILCVVDGCFVVMLW